MTAVKATLSVILKADEVVVAEVEDAELWQRVLSAINDGSSTLTTASPISNGIGNLRSSGPPAALHGSGLSADSNLDGFAEQLGVDRATLEGACSPVRESPYMHLDLHCWEAMKNHLPARGVGSIASLAVPATLLALWLKRIELGSPTQSQAQAVLNTIGAEDKNASRSIQNTDWLQSRGGGQIVLNPAQISKAVKLARCFCLKDWSAWIGTGATS